MYERGQQCAGLFLWVKGCGRVALVIISFDIARRVAGACVPVGGELDYLDEGTLAAAIKARKTL